MVAKWKWEEAVIERAERLTLEGISVPIPRTSDLILLKLAAGGYLDLQDIYALLHAGDREQLIRDVLKRVAGRESGLLLKTLPPKAVPQSRAFTEGTGPGRD